VKQSNNERKMLDALFEKKSNIAYDIPYISSSIITTKPLLGTIESDVSGKYGRWNKENFRAEKLANISLQFSDITKILDIGGGNLLASSFYTKNGKVVDVCDFATSPYLESHSVKDSKIRNFIDGDFNKVNFSEKYDLVWASHILEHQLDVHSFLCKAIDLIVDDGYLAITVPPRKPFIVSGHINLFNPGLLVYRIILAGVDCSSAKVFQYDGNISLLVKISRIKLPALSYDIGDIKLLSKYFPFDVEEGFNGDFAHCNLEEDEVKMVYEKNTHLHTLKVEEKNEKI
jgi:SAM-dependent methyltransferase